MSSTETAPPQTPEEFAAHVAAIENEEGYEQPAAFAVGWAMAHGTQMLSCMFSVVNYRQNYGSAAILANKVGYQNGTGTFRVRQFQLQEAFDCFAPFKDEWEHGDGSRHANMTAIWAASKLNDIEMLDDWGSSNKPRFATDRTVFPVIVFIGDLNEPPTDVCDAYLRLHLLSNRKVQPHEINLDGLFGILPNVVWTDAGPYLADNFESHVRLPMLAEGLFLHIYSVDKFPPMLDYVVPSGVRVGDGARVRLGAHLGEGTTVMHEGFVNFNAGTVGKSMVEGRISAGVVVGDGSDLGGSCSTMGTLSGGGKEVITVGEGCLIGANAGIGISLGDHCTVEAGLYITAGMPVMLICPDGAREVKARELSGKPGLLFRRNGILGQIEVVPNDNANWEGLNDILHNN